MKQIERDGMGPEGRERDEFKWNATGWDGMGWGWDGDGMGWDGMGMGWDGMGWDGLRRRDRECTERQRALRIVADCCILARSPVGCSLLDVALHRCIVVAL